MSQANDLLESLSDEEIQTYLADADSEPHIIIGADRHILVPEALKRIAVQYDHDIETVTFDCPRYWDGLDMSTMAIYINYMRADKYTDSYATKKPTVSGDTMTFSWTISRNVTQVAGKISFLVCVKNTDAEGNEVNHWNSELCQDMYVSEGMETEEQLVDIQPDLVSQLLLRMNTVEEINITTEYANQIADRAYGSELEAYGAMEVCANIRDQVYEARADIQNSYANAIKGKVSGEIVRVDDVSPLEHDINIKVRGKNLIPYPYSDTNLDTHIKESNGITFTDNGDGSITANGTATGNAVFYFINYGNSFYVDGDVCLSGCPEGGSFTGSGYSLRLNKYVDGVEQSGIVDTGSGRAESFNNMQIRLYFVILAGTTVENLTVWPMLEYGNVPTDYAPWLDPSTVIWTACGKNMFSYPYDGTAYANGITFTNRGDGSIRLNGTNDGAGNSVFYLTKDSYYTLPAGTYQCSPNIAGVAIMGVEKGGGYFTFCSVNKTTFTLAEATTFRSIYIQILKGAENTYSNVIIKPMLEYSKSASEFEPYSGDSDYCPADGAVVTSSMGKTTRVIFTDTPGAIVEVEYNRDTTKMFESYVLTDEAKSEIAALVESDMAEVLKSLNAYAENIIGGDA